MNLNLLIPMAGKGSRFKEAKYETFKPFIKINQHNETNEDNFIHNKSIPLEELVEYNEFETIHMESPQIKLSQNGDDRL